MDRAKPPGGTETDMRFSSYVEKMGGGDTAAVHDAWSVHGKARQRQRAGEDIILLSIGDHDFATDPRIVAAAKTCIFFFTSTMSTA